ncbi:ABC transporter ATP-binding protein [Agrococcus terreus]|uniref:Polysaccharide ABC transporter ATP-binding protein n=1 Tax=Agrococcus terreus TaxID=574649 RepID=A0ABQ2KHX1_9MICO|nr:ABC transporter ATP-binding protein [Agrococcus terreus]GGN79919.1 polysaccharide ABC transporter ATP-binding protein [Agrococcus terreus]
MSDFQTGWHLSSDPKVTIAADNVRLRYRVQRSGPRSFRSILGKRPVSGPVLRGVSLAAREGEMVGLVGLNGSGKSSLLRVLAGLQPATSGTVVASAQPQLLGVSAALVPELSGLENIWLGTLAMGMTPDEAYFARERIELLADLGEAIKQPMSTYSSGMAARLRFAISVAADPEILMIDEALSTGDASFTERAKEAMHGLIARAGTVFLVSHAAQTIEDMCTRALWLDAGTLIADGPAGEVANMYRYYAHSIALGKDRAAKKALVSATESHPPLFSGT